MKPITFLIMFIIAGSMLSGCAAAEVTTPQVIINAPASGTQYRTGEEVVVQSTSSDAQGVVKVELVVDGQVVRTDTIPTGKPQSHFVVSQSWKATTPGSHVVLVRTTNSRGATGESALDLRIIAETAAAMPTNAPAAASPTASPPATTTPAASQLASPSVAASSACVPNSLYVSDLTIPDGMTIAAGATAVKTWRVKNNGTCPWDSGYALVLVSGEQMGAPSPAPVPAAAPGATVDVSITIVVPASAGAHSGVFRLRAPNGTVFGTNLTIVLQSGSAGSQPSATPLPGGSSYTLTLTQAQVNAMLTSVLAASGVENVSAATVTLQNGQILATATLAGLGGISMNGTVALTVTASGCDVHVTVNQATVGPVSMPDARKAAISQAVEKALKTQLAQSHDYRCVDSIVVANGIMTIKYH